MIRKPRNPYCQPNRLRTKALFQIWIAAPKYKRSQIKLSKTNKGKVPPYI